MAVAEWLAEDAPKQGCPDTANKVDGVDLEIETGLLEKLAQRGIERLGGAGLPTPSVTDAVADPLRPAVPARHLQSVYMSASAKHELGRVQAQVGRDDKARLHSAGGPTAGTCMVTGLTAGSQLHFTDQQWMAAIRWRWGLSQGQQGALCRNWNAQRSCQCNEVLDANGNHAADCPCGPLRTIRHDSLCDEWGEIFEEVGATARREIFCEELSKPSKEAWLDVWACGTPELSSVYFDVTARNPRAERYVQKAAETEGATATKAEGEKAETYPPRGGKQVVALSHELWGRLGSQAEHILHLCAALGARRDHRAGRPPAQRLRRWRATLDATLHRAVADQLLVAWAGLPGRPLRRVQPGTPAATRTLQERSLV